MKYLMIIVLLCFEQRFTQPCEKFHTGTFILPSVDGSNHIIKRTKKKQIEIVSSKGVQSEYELEWIDSCTYILYNRKVTIGIDEYPELNKDTLYNQITPITKTKIKVTSWMRDSDKFDSEMTKLE